MRVERIAVEEVMVVLRIARVVIKASGETYDCYSVPSESDQAVTYCVWVNTTTGWPCRCQCKIRQFGGRLCKHMVKVKQWLDEQRRTLPLYRKEFSVMR